MKLGTNATVNPDGLTTGSSLYPVGLYQTMNRQMESDDIASPTISGGTLSGTWRCMGFGVLPYNQSIVGQVSTLWVRIA